MTCSECGARLDDYLDGALSTAERALVEAHLASCQECREELSGQKALLSAARILPRSIQPEQDLWRGIEPRLMSEQRSGSTPPRSRPVPRWALAAAAILLVAIGAALATVWQRRAAPDSFTTATARYATESAALADRLNHAARPLSPVTQAVVARNLAIVDAAIKEAEAALAADPGNAALEHIVIAAYQQRLALLRGAVAADGTES